MEKWSESLSKNKIDETIFEVDGEISAADRNRIENLQFHCEGVFRDRDRIKKVRSLVRRKAKEKPHSLAVKAVADGILEELDEIESDLKFASSRRGKFVLFANDWAQEIYATLRKNKRLASIAMGPHSEQERIVVHGTLKAAGDLLEVVRLLDKNQPGVPIEYRVTVDA